VNSIKNLDNRTILIRAGTLSTDTPNFISIHLQKGNIQIINGTVYTASKEPCKGAVIEVTQISIKDYSRIVLGYVITDYNGEYAIAIRAKWHEVYELTVYLPLIS
jgi:hypothetical protein